MSEIYKYKHQSRLPVVNSNSMTIAVYWAFEKIYNKNFILGNTIKGTNESVCFGSCKVNGFLVNNAEILQSIAIFTIGSERCTRKDIAFRKKGSVFNIKHIKHSQFMYDTKYNKAYSNKWWRR